MKTCKFANKKMIRKITSIIPEHWRMDGGVAFGVVPKSIWKKFYPAADDNTISIVNRCLLIETDNNLVLINAGFGNKRNEKYYSYKYFEQQTPLVECIRKAGYEPENITHVILTHLHDDHCGGITHMIDGEAKPLFPNAQHIISKAQWEWALNPNAREGASYFNDNLLPLEASGNLTLIEPNEQPLKELNIQLHHFDGHTKGQIIPYIDFNGQTMVYVSDFIPSSAHIPLPYIASVDIFPFTTLTEKQTFLENAHEHKHILIFEHDTDIEACLVEKTEKGFVASKQGAFSQFFFMLD
jgi:glyoxylase-like metal-dependent hydrolase (beta-lactamase superfamily II)